MGQITLTPAEVLDRCGKVQTRCRIDEATLRGCRLPLVDPEVDEYIWGDYLQFKHTRRKLTSVVANITAARRIQTDLPSLRLTIDRIKAVHDAPTTHTAKGALYNLLQRRYKHRHSLSIIIQHLWHHIVMFMNDINERCDLARAFPELIDVRDVELASGDVGFWHGLKRVLAVRMGMYDRVLDGGVAAECALCLPCVFDRAGECMGEVGRGDFEGFAERVHRHVLVASCENGDVTDGAAVVPVGLKDGDGDCLMVRAVSWMCEHRDERERCPAVWRNLVNAVCPTPRQIDLR